MFFFVCLCFSLCVCVFLCVFVYVLMSTEDWGNGSVPFCQILILSNPLNVLDLERNKGILFNKQILVLFHSYLNHGDYVVTQWMYNY